MELSVLRQKQERFQEALEYGGRSLFIRVKLSSLLADHLRTNVTLAGVLKKSIDTKVSDSHYHLANVYRQGFNVCIHNSMYIFIYYKNCFNNSLQAAIRLCKLNKGTISM